MGTEFSSYSTYFLLRLAGVLLIFLPCLWAARRRWRNASPGNRALGIVLSALVPMAGYPLFFGALAALLAPVLLVYAAILVVFWLALPAVASAVVADLALRLLGATRTAAWLALGIAAALAITLFWFSWFFGGLPVLIPALLPEYAMVALVPASSALIWWSYLPPAPASYAATFE